MDLFNKRNNALKKEVAVLEERLNRADIEISDINQDLISLKKERNTLYFKLSSFLPDDSLALEVVKRMQALEKYLGIDKIDDFEDDTSYAPEPRKQVKVYKYVKKSKVKL